MKVWWETFYLHSVKIFTNFNRKCIILTVEKPTRHYLSKWSKLTLLEMRHVYVCIMCLQKYCTEKCTNSTSVEFLRKRKICLIMKKHINPNWGMFYEITEQCSLKVSWSWKSEIDFRRCLALKKNEETWIAKISVWSWIWPWTRKGNFSGTIDES